MDLIFTKSETGKSWVAEFEATADFNLHIEKPTGTIVLYQRTAGGKYDAIEGVDYMEGNSVFDYDCTALIYPKWIKIVSEVKPTYAAVTSAGEVTEIKSQDKSVEVTSNGTIDVTPDAGFAYLNSVKVKTNVAQSGEGGGSTGGGSASSVEYWDIRNLGGIGRDLTLMSCYAVKGVALGAKGVFTVTQYSLVNGSQEDIEAVAIVPSLGLGNEETHETVEQSLITAGVDTTSIPRLTKEEFYNLNGGGIA